MNLHEAARIGALLDVQILLAEGAEINSRDRQFNGLTPLMYAAINGHLTVLKCLIQAGANLNLVDYQGYSALDAALSSGEKYSIVESMVFELLHSGANPNIGKSSLISWTASLRKPELAAVCLAYGAKQVHNNFVKHDSRLFGASTKKEFEELLNNPLSLQSQSIRHIRRYVSIDDIPKLPLPERMKERCLDPAYDSPRTFVSKKNH